MNVFGPHGLILHILELILKREFKFKFNLKSNKIDENVIIKIPNFHHKILFRSNDTLIKPDITDEKSPVFGQKFNFDLQYTTPYT